MNPTEFLLWESSSRDTIDFKKIYVDITGDLAAGLLLSQVVYWYLPNVQGASKLRVQKDGHFWIAKQWDGWWAEVRLTEKQAIRAGEILISLGIAVKQVYKFAGERTVHLRLNWDVFLPLWKATLEKSEVERNAEPHTRTKRPNLPRRPKAPNGSRTPQAETEAGEPGEDSQNAQREFSKTPKGSFAKRPKGATENAQRELSITESTPESTSKTLTKRGGVLDGISEAQAAQLAEHAASVVVATGAAYSSSKDAALQKDEAGQSEFNPGTSTASPEVVPPVAMPEQQPEPTAPMVEQDLPEHSSSEADTPEKTDGGLFEMILHDLSVTAATIPPTVLEQLSPDGDAADAADEAPDISLEEVEALFASGEPQPTNPENVPGGVAAGRAAGQEAPSGDGDGPRISSVNDLAPIPRAELLSRSLAGPESEVYRALRALVGNGLPKFLAEVTRTGGLLRQDHWPLLTVAEIRSVTAVAQVEAQTTQDSMVTLGIRGLDRLVGAVKGNPPKGGAPKTEGSVGPVDLSHLDPHLVVGQRCTLRGQLGVVHDVRNNGHIVQLDTRDLVTVDRAEAKQLKQLKVSDAPLPVVLPVTSAVAEAPKGRALDFLKMARGAGVDVPLPAGD